jgi:hypothetical protein
VTNEGLFVIYQNVEGWDDRPKPYSPEALQRWWEEYRSRPYKAWAELYRLDEGGKLALVNKVEWTRPAETISKAWFYSRDVIDRSQRVLLAFSPGAYDFISWPKELQWSGSPKQTLDKGLNWTNTIFIVGEIMKRSATNGYAHWIISLLLACVAMWHQWPRRTSWARLAGWAALVLLFNLAGLLTYWAMNHMPVIRCAACGRKRGLNRPDCRACGKPLPPPQPREPNLIIT